MANKQSKPKATRTPKRKSTKPVKSSGGSKVKYVRKKVKPVNKDARIPKTKSELEREIQEGIVRYTRIWRYSTKLALEYAESQGHPMSESTYYEIKKEQREKSLQGDVFTKQALENLRLEHGDSLELINNLLNVIITEIRDHSATAIFNVLEDKQGNKSYVFSKNHNSLTVAKLITVATDLMTKRDNTILATPIINELTNELSKNNGD